MATKNLLKGDQSVTPNEAASLTYGRTDVMLETVIDFTKVAGGSTDVYNLINVPAGYAVMASGMEVLIADTAGNSGTLVLKVGSASQGSAETVAATGFIASAGTFTPVVPSGTAAIFTATGATGTINGVIRFFIWLRDCRMKLGTGVVIGTTTNPAGATVANVVSPSVAYTFETATNPVP